MRHWNSPSFNPLTDKRSEMSKNKTRANSSLIQYTLFTQICFRPELSLLLAVAFAIFLRKYLLLHSTISTEERRKRAVYILPLTHTSICTMKRMIGRGTFNRPIIWSFVRPDRIVLQHSFSLYNCRISTQHISQDIMRLHRTSIVRNHASIVQVIFHM